MSRRRLAQLLTAAALVVVAGVIALRRQEQRPPSPQDAIYRMLDAARDADTAAYLDCYTGSMRSSLDRTLAELGQENLRKYLRDSNASIRGVALQEPQPLTDSEVKVRVEYVYQDRNEVQTMYLEKRGEFWKISRVDAAEKVKTLIPYGTPVQ